MLRTIVVLVAITVAIVGAFVSPFYGLLGYLWFALFRPQEWVWFDLTALRLSLVLGVLVLGRAVLAGYLPLVGHRLALGMIGFLATSFVAQLNAFAPAVGWQWIDFLAKLVIVSLLVARLVDDSQKLALTIGVIAASFGFHTTKAGALFVSVGGVRFADGLAGAYIDNNGYALGAVVILPLLWATAQGAKFFGWRWIYRGFMVAVPLTAATVIGTYSRGGLLGLIAVGATALVFARRRFLKISGIAVLAIVVAPFVTLPSGYQDRMATIRTYEHVGEESAMSRLHFWAVAVRMAEANPLGVGLRNYDYAYDRYDDSGALYGTFRSVHSSHFQVLAENGYLGALLWIFLLAESFRTCFVLRRAIKRSTLPEPESVFLAAAATALMMSMAGFVVTASFIALALNDLTWLTFGLVIAFDRVARQRLAAVAPPVNTAVVGPRVLNVTPRVAPRSDLGTPAARRRMTTD